MKMRLTGQTLSDVYARQHPIAQENPGKVYAIYLGGGWIELRGNDLKSSIYPHTWTMVDRIRSKEARERLGV